MKHRVYEGRIYRDVTLEAADVHDARRHISAERPEPLTREARICREQLEAAR
jgi:hypothetical protein